MKIAVLMSTYNGEKYLREQIESILAQKLHSDCRLSLYIRDDGSTDQTTQIIETYSEEHENVIYINDSYPSPLGIKESFLLLLKTASSSEQRFDYYAFSDQDDVWMEDKLVSAIDMLRASDNKKGALYYSNRIIVNEKLQITEKEHINYYGDFIEMLSWAKVSGNTMAFDHKLAEYAMRHNAQINIHHDTWVYTLAKCIGSDIFFDEAPHIYYRQHSDNFVGYSHGSHGSWPYLIKNFFPRLVKHRDHLFQNLFKDIYRSYREDLDSKAIDYINLIMKYNKNFRSKWALLTDRNIKKRPFWNRCIYFYKVLFNMI